MKRADVSQTFPNISLVSPQTKYCSLHPDEMGSGDQKVLVLFSLLLGGEIGYEIKTERTKELQIQLFFFNFTGWNCT